MKFEIEEENLSPLDCLEKRIRIDELNRLSELLLASIENKPIRQVLAICVVERLKAIGIKFPERKDN